jgi:hypothetical protein
MSRKSEEKIAVAFLILIGLSADAGVYAEDLSKWKATEPPERGGDRWLAANHDSHEWEVYLRENGVSVRPRVAQYSKEKGWVDRQENCSAMPFEVKKGTQAEGMRGDVVCTDVFDGWIIAYNAGEFGGWVWWFSPDGSRKYQINSNANVIGFIRTETGLLAVEGLAHGRSSGKLLRLRPNGDGIWSAELFLDIKYAPEAFFKESAKSVVIATSEQLIRVHLDSAKLNSLARSWDG